MGMPSTWPTAAPPTPFSSTGRPRTFTTDVQPAGKALGLAKPLPLRFYQASLEPGAELIFCPEPPVTWNANTLAGGAKLALDQLLQRLLLRHGSDFACGVVQFQPGVGRISEVRAQPNPLGKTPVLVGKPANPLLGRAPGSLARRTARR